MNILKNSQGISMEIQQDGPLAQLKKEKTAFYLAVGKGNLELIKYLLSIEKIETNFINKFKTLIMMMKKIYTMMQLIVKYKKQWKLNSRQHYNLQLKMKKQIY